MQNLLGIIDRRPFLPWPVWTTVCGYLGATQANVNLSKWHKFNIICATPEFDLTEQNSDLAELGSTYVPCKSSELNVISLFFLWKGRIEIEWHFRGSNPDPFYRKPKLYPSANQAMPYSRLMIILEFIVIKFPLTKRPWRWKSHFDYCQRQSLVCFSVLWKAFWMISIRLTFVTGFSMPRELNP